MTQMKTVVLVFLVFFGMTPSWGSRDPFQVRFIGLKGQQIMLQKQVELVMVKSLAYCRGFTMSKKVDEWSCKPLKKSLVSCSTAFRCANIRRGFSRSSEQKRLGRELAKFKGQKVSKYKLMVAKKPYKALTSKKAKKAKKKIVNKQVPKMTPVVPVEKKAKAKVKEVASPLVFKEEGIELFNDDKVEQEQAASLEQELGDLMGEDEQKAESKSGEKKWGSRGEDWRFAEVDREEIKREERLKSPYQLRRFATQVLYASDDSDNTYFTILGLSYTPTFRLSPKVYLQAEFSVHQFSLDETESFVEESFLVYTYAAQLHYMFNERFEFHAGLGLQPWGASRLQSPNFFRVSYGGTYHFKKNIWGYMDRAFLTIANLSTDATSVSEVRLGVGFTF